MKWAAKRLKRRKRRVSRILPDSFAGDSVFENVVLVPTLCVGTSRSWPDFPDMSRGTDWQPSASPEVLRLRARLLARVRRFFDSRGFWEVDTPLVSHERAIDPHIDPLAVVDPVARRAEARPALFLQ